MAEIVKITLKGYYRKTKGIARPSGPQIRHRTTPPTQPYFNFDSRLCIPFNEFSTARQLYQNRPLNFDGVEKLTTIYATAICISKNGHQDYQYHHRDGVYKQTCLLANKKIKSIYRNEPFCNNQSEWCVCYL